MEKRQSRRHRTHRMSGAILFGMIVVITGVARAEDTQLLDVLRQKDVLTQQEYERLKGTELTPAQRAGLIDVLRAKGVLTKDEAAKLESGAPAAPTAPAAAVVAQAAEKPAATSPQVGYDEGFFLRTQDGNFVMRFNGRIAEDFLFSEPNTSQPSDTQTIDRARLSVDVTVYKYFRMRLENEFSSGAFSGSSGLRDAFIAVTPMPEFNLQAGQYPVPFSYELIVSKRYTNFVERAAVVNDTVNPRRDIGVMAYGQFANKLVQYQLAGMNGAGQNVADNNSDKDLVAHLVVAPFVNGGPEHLRGFNVGSGVTWGHQPGETVSSGKSTTSSITGQTETGFTFFPAVTRHGDRLRWGSARGVARWTVLSGQRVHPDRGGTRRARQQGQRPAQALHRWRLRRRHVADHGRDQAVQRAHPPEAAVVGSEEPGPRRVGSRAALRVLQAPPWSRGRCRRQERTPNSTTATMRSLPESTGTPTNSCASR